MKSNTLCLVLPPGLLAGSSATDEFRCEPCNKNLTSLTRLKRHIQNVHTRPSKEPICNICKRVYSSLNSLRNHKSIYHRQHGKIEQQRKEEEQQREREIQEQTFIQQQHYQRMGWLIINQSLLINHHYCAFKYWLTSTLKFNNYLI